LEAAFGVAIALVRVQLQARSFVGLDPIPVEPDDDGCDSPTDTIAALLGLFKPLLAAFFAAFTLVLVEAQLINFPEASLVYSALAIAFVAGFSERFGEDLTKAVAHNVRTAAPRAKSWAVVSNSN
jgi:hypothetical protein